MIDTVASPAFPGLRPGDEEWLDADALGLGGGEVDALSDAQCLDLLAALRRVRARADAIETRMVARFNQLRGGVRGTADEVAYELRVTRHVAASRIDTAELLVGRHPRVLAALHAGEFEGYAAGRVAELTAALPDALAREVDRRLAGVFGECRTPGELRRATREIVLEVDPDGQARRAKRARAARKVELIPGEDAMSTVSAQLPAEVAAAAYSSVDAAARRLRRQGDERTLDQLRADIVGERLIGIDAVNTGPHAGSRTGSGAGAQVFLHMPLDAALGISDDGCELAGYGAIPGPIARHIMGDENSIWRKVICDPATGAVLDLGRSRYRPTAAIRAIVAIRDRECGAPGCHRPAEHCDFDHVRSRANHGITSVGNGAPACEYHNNLKEQPNWRVVFDHDAGTYTLITPTGRKITKKRRPIWKPKPRPKPPPLPDNPPF